MNDEQEVAYKIDFVFPKPLDPLELEVVTDLSGFTNQEKLTLRNFWSSTGPYAPQISITIYVDFFCSYENSIEDFRRIELENKLDFELMSRFVKSFIHLIGNIIHKCLDSGSYIKVILCELIKNHLVTDLPINHFELFVEFVRNYLTENPHHLPTPTLTIALEKLCYLITEVYGNISEDLEDVE